MQIAENKMVDRIIAANSGGHEHAVHGVFRRITNGLSSSHQKPDVTQGDVTLPNALRRPFAWYRGGIPVSRQKSAFIPPCLPNAVFSGAPTKVFAWRKLSLISVTTSFS